MRRVNCLISRLLKFLWLLVRWFAVCLGRATMMLSRLVVRFRILVRLLRRGLVRVRFRL